MKKLIFLLALTSIFFTADAQKMKTAEVPELIRIAFSKAYPAAQNVHWEKEKANYEAGFELSEVDYSVVLNEAGQILETEVEIAVTDLPVKVQEYLSANYPKQKIKEAARITNAQGIIAYEAEINGKDLLFDVNGNLLKNE